jgi:hypothetical protein
MIQLDNDPVTRRNHPRQTFDLDYQQTFVAVYQDTCHIPSSLLARYP